MFAPSWRRFVWLILEQPADPGVEWLLRLSGSTYHRPPANQRGCCLQEVEHVEMFRCQWFSVSEF